MIEGKALARLEVASGAKRPVAGAGDDDGTDIRVIMGKPVAFGDTVHHAAVDCIAFVLPVERDPEGCALFFVEDYVAHGSTFSISAISRPAATWSPTTAANDFSRPPIGAV